MEQTGIFLLCVTLAGTAGMVAGILLVAGFSLEIRNQRDAYKRRCDVIGEHQATRGTNGSARYLGRIARGEVDV